MLQFCLENHWDIPTIEKALKVIAKIYSRLSIASKVNLLGSSLLINYLKAISSQAKAAQSSSHTSCVVRPFNLISFDKLVTNIIQSPMGNRSIMYHQVTVFTVKLSKYWLSKDVTYLPLKLAVM